ncbi:hypothetical protein EGY31_15135 [Burkholderia multivorans]|nr:hypothetical protein EGY31_15135 [Burkholderia multivorans]
MKKRSWLAKECASKRAVRASRARDAGCRQCDTLVQEPVPAQVTDKGIAAAGLPVQALANKSNRGQPGQNENASDWSRPGKGSSRARSAPGIAPPPP